MLRVRKAARVAARTRFEEKAPAPTPREHRVLVLQRAIGNRAVNRLLQRDFDRDLGPTTRADWTTKRAESVSVVTLYEEIAKLAKADTLRDVRATGAKINTVRKPKEGEKTVKPELNLAGAFDDPQAGGETGFVDADGAYHGPRLPVTLDGGLPTVAVLLGPKAFDRGKDHAYAVLRHELEHPRHFEMMIDKLGEWRAIAAKKRETLTAGQARVRFDRWVVTTKTLEKVKRSLLVGEQDQNQASTELLAYVEGFVSVFHLGPQTPDLKLMLTGDFPAAIHQLWKAGEKGNGASDAVGKLALARLKDYERNFLTAAEKKAFRSWVTFMIDLGTQKPPTDQTDEAKARRLAHARLSEKPVLDWLKSL
jgi:hypothetical protein